MPRPMRRRRARLTRLSVRQTLELTIGPSPRAIATGDYAFRDDAERLRALEVHRHQLGAVAGVWLRYYDLPPEWEAAATPQIGDPTMPTFQADPDLERLIELRESDPDRFDQAVDLSGLVALESYEPRKAAAIAAGATVVTGAGQEDPS